MKFNSVSPHGMMGWRRFLSRVRSLFLLGVAACVFGGMFPCDLAAQTAVPAMISTNSTWSPAGNPYQVSADATVPSGVILHINPGTVVQIANGHALTILGRIEALGSVGSPVQFTAPPAAAFGGSLNIQGTSLALEATGILDHCSFTALSNEFQGAVFASNAYVTLSSSLISNCLYVGFLAIESRFYVIQNAIHHVGGGVNALSCAGLVSSNVISDILGTTDGIDMDAIWPGNGDPSIILEWNQISDDPQSGSDGIDFDGGIPTIRYNSISNVEDCGITLGGGTQGDVYDNLVRICRVGIAIDDGASPVVMNNTFLNAGFGVRSRKRYFATGGRGGLTNSIIWSCQTNIELDAYSQLSVGNCDIQGSGVWPGTGNINADPVFVNAAAGDFHIGPSSPCIDHGVNLPFMLDKGDLDKNPRPLDASMDMGSYEFSRSLVIMVPTNVSEGAGVLTNAGLVQLPVAPISNVVVSLQSSATQYLSVASQTTIPAGQTSATFTLTIYDNAVLDGGRLVSVSGSGAGCRNGTGTVVIADNETASLGLSVPGVLQEGNPSVTGTVYLSAIPASAVSVALASSHPTRLIVPASVIVSGGTTSQTFSVQTPDNGNLDGTVSASITASVAGWTNAVAATVLYDNEPTNLSLSLVGAVFEGDGFISAAGSVHIGGVAVSNIVVSLVSSDPSELTVPVSVTILSGTTSALISVTVQDDGLPDGDKNVTVTAAAGGLSSGSTNVIVRDNDVQRLGFNTLGGAQTAGVPFAVTIQALAADGVVISNYIAQLTLTGSNATGLISLSPSVVSVTSNGTWQGNVVVNDIGTGIRLYASDGAGRSGGSNPFDASGGVMDHFGVDNVDSQRFAGRPFLVTVTARDAMNNLVPNYLATVGLKAVVQGTIRTNTFLPSTAYNRTATGTRTAGVRFYLATTVTVTHVRSFWGSKVSLWTDAGQLLTSKSVSGTGGQWTETALDTPLTLPGGATYRIGAFGTNVTYYYQRTGTPLGFTDGTISEGCSTASDAFPGPTNNSRYLVDMRYSVANNQSATLLPTNTSAFAMGAWTGNVTIAQQVQGVAIQALDGSGFTGESALFNVGTGFYVTVSANTGGTVSPSGTVAVTAGSNMSFTIQADSGHWINTVTTNGVSVGSAHGTNAFVLAWGSVLADSALNISFMDIPSISNMQAYDDLGWNTGDLATRITTNSPYGVKNGNLIDYSTGLTAPANVTIGASGIAAAQGLLTGIPIPVGSDAYQAFNGKVTCDNYSYWAVGTVTLAFSNLVSTGNYSFVLFGSRGSNAEKYSNRWVDVVISDVSGYANNSSVATGVTRFDSASPQDGTRLTGANMDGNVVRYDGIVPGADGDIHFTFTAGADPVLGQGSNAYINAFMLQQTGVVGAASHTITVSFGGGGSVSPSGSVVVANASNVAFTVQAQPYYHILMVTTNGGALTNLQGAASGVVIWSNVVANGLFNSTFDETRATNGVPQTWLVAHSLTNGGFDSAALADQDGDGAATWEEYIAGTDPTSKLDCLQLNPSISSSRTSMAWHTITGRTYAVISSPNIAAAFTNVGDPAYTNLPGTGQDAAYTNQSSIIQPIYFRVKAHGPN